MCTHHLHWYEQKLIVQLGFTFTRLLFSAQCSYTREGHTHAHTRGQKVNMFRMMQTQLKQALWITTSVEQQNTTLNIVCDFCQFAHQSASLAFFSDAACTSDSICLSDLLPTLCFLKDSYIKPMVDMKCKKKSSVIYHVPHQYKCYNDHCHIVYHFHFSVMHLPRIIWSFSWSNLTMPGFWGWVTHPVAKTSWGKMNSNNVGASNIPFLYVNCLYQLSA